MEPNVNTLYVRFHTVSFVNTFNHAWNLRISSHETLLLITAAVSNLVLQGLCLATPVSKWKYSVPASIEAAFCKQQLLSKHVIAKRGP